jgi:phage gp29-like protein
VPNPASKLSVTAENAKLEAENVKLQDANQKLTEIASEMEGLKKAVTTLQQKAESSVRTAALGR